MSTSAVSVSRFQPVPRMHTIQLYLRECRYEFMRALRNKGFAVGVVGFPAMFYLLFGVSNRSATLQGGAFFAKYLLASYTAFGTVGAALFGIGVGLALERTSGWLELKRACPMPPLAYLLARCVMAMLFSLLITNLLCGIGITAAGVSLSGADYLRLCLVAITGSIPFASMGLLLAMLLPANSAPGIVNMLYLPMSYAAGLWIPLAMLPHLVQRVAPWLPTYHLAQLALHAIGYAQPGDSLLQHGLALAGFTCLFLAGAAVLFSRREEA